MKLQAYGFSVLRRPLLSRNILESFHQKTGDDPALFETELKRIFSDPVLLEGLQLASGPLYHTTVIWLKQGDVSGKEKLLTSLYKFLIRACSRCTPFGLFAGYLTLETDSRTQISFFGQSQLDSHSRLDIRASEKLKAHVLKNGNLRAQLLFYPSSSLYRAGQTYRYIKRQDENTEAAFILSQAAYHPALEKLLIHAKNGLTPGQLSNILQREKLSAKSARTYVKALIDAQILTSSIELNATGQDYLSSLTNTLSGLKRSKTLTNKLMKIQNKLKQNSSPIQINRPLQEFLQQDHPLESTVHTTLKFRAQTATLSRSMLCNLGSMLSRIAPLIRQLPSEDLQDFTRRFFARYGQQSIPLLLALDYDYGIGYSALSSETRPELPLLSGMNPNGKEITEHQTNDLAERLYQSTLPGGSPQVMLTESLFQMQKKQTDQQLPSSFYVLGSLHARSQEALDEGDFLFELKGLFGPSASNLMTRFCEDDPVLTCHVRDMIRSEENQDENLIYAEIAHLPAGKAGNIVQRPDLRSYQIAYLAKNSKEPDKSISPADLFLSCPDGKNLVLTTPLLKRPIMPVLSSAHNFHSGLPVYRFLCDLANSSTVCLAWDWGKYQNAPFLPRVQYEKLVLSKASWLLSSGPASAQSVIAWWKEIKKRLGIPRYLTAGTGDQTLLIDSAHERPLSLLAQMLKKEGSLRITESLENPGEGWIMQDGNYFASELVIPFKHTEKTKSIARKFQIRLSAKPIKVTRNFTLASSWLYFKIYCAESVSDSLLTETLFPLLVSLEKRRMIQKWFFIRYHDPAPHIRLRFYGEKENFWMVVFKELHHLIEPLLESGMVHSIHSDRYQRELERFPAGAYAQIESFFHRDSIAVTRCLNQLAQDPALRWQGALLGTDLMLGDLGFDLEGKSDLLQQMHRQFSDELDKDGLLRRQMDQNYRAQKQQINQVMGNQKPAAILRIYIFLSRRTRQLKSLSTNPIFQDGSVKESLAVDLVHLFLNRWFYNHQRQQEFAIYHYLKKYYTCALKNKITR